MIFGSLLERLKYFSADILIFLTVFTSSSYFFSSGAWNQTAIYDSIFAAVEKSIHDTPLFSIDTFLVKPKEGINTGDWSFYNGHYYSNKAPGTTLLGIPCYAFLRHIENELTPKNVFTGILFLKSCDLFNIYFLNLFISSFWIAVAIVFFRKLLLNLHLSKHKALFFSLALFFCTPLFPFSTQLWGHCTAAAFLILGTYNITQKRTANLLYSGFFMGMATLCDYFAAVFTLVFCLYILMQNRKHFYLYLLGGLPPLMLFGAYHWICFGAPWALATFFNNPIFINPEYTGGIFGDFSFYHIIALLTSMDHGLLITSPFLILTFSGLLYIFKKKSPESGIIISGGISFIFLIFINASFNGWNGGTVIGARYLIIAVPFLLIIAASAQYGYCMKVAALALALMTFLQNLILASFSPIPVLNISNPFIDIYYKNFFTNKFPHFSSFFEVSIMPRLFEAKAFNWGSLLGLQGIMTIIPFFVILFFFAILIIRKFEITLFKKTEVKKNTKSL